MTQVNKIPLPGRRIKHWALGLVAGLTILFAFQNQLSVKVQFLFWSLEISRFALIAGTFVAGLFCGWLVQHLRSGSRPDQS